jgi:carbon-monoxide dehydrogenase medium subunit
MSFDLVTPRSLAEAVALLDRDDPAVRPIAGGTALLLMLKSGLYRPTRLISLRALGGELGQIRGDADGGLRIGAMVRLAELERSPGVWRAAPVIARMLRTHSNVRVRNVATVGGNLAHGDPHMDLPPVLIALGAEVEAVGPGGRRRLPVEDLYAGYLETVLAGDELIAELVVPSQHGRRAYYAKCTARAADDWPALGVAVALGRDSDRIAEPRIVVGAATETPMRLMTAEAVLREGRIGEALLREAGRAAAAEAPVVADDHGSAAYKRQLVEIYVRRAILGALG